MWRGFREDGRCSHWHWHIWWWSGHWVIHIVNWNTMERGLPPSRCVCVEWNTTWGRGSLRLQGQPPNKHKVSGGRPCKHKLPCLLAKARVGELMFQDRAPKVAKQGREWQWGGQFRKNKPPGWSCCRNKSGGGQGSGQCAGGGVYVSKTVDNKRKWLAYLLALCMFSCLFLPTCPLCCI